MNILMRIWQRAVESLFDLAIGLMIRGRYKLLPPKPVVWQDPRPYRFWSTGVLRVEFADSQIRDIHPDDSEERAVQCALMLEEILARRGQKSQPRNCGYD